MSWAGRIELVVTIASEPHDHELIADRVSAAVREAVTPWQVAGNVGTLTIERKTP
jgi:hypothetical protein